MSEKRIFAGIVAGLLRDLPTARNIVLLDQEGIPISFVTRTRKEKVDPQKYGSQVRALFFPAKNLAKSVGAEAPLLHLLVFEESVLTLVNLGYALLAIAQDITGFPLPHDLLEKVASQLAPVFPELERAESSLLKELSLSEGGTSGDLNYAERYLGQLKEIAIGIAGGTFQHQPAVTDKDEPREAFPELLSGVDLFGAAAVAIFGADGRTLAQAGGSVDPTAKNVFEIPAQQAKELKAGELLFTVTGLTDASLFLSCPVGAEGSGPIIMTVHHPSSNVGFRSVMSPVYSVAKGAELVCGSELSRKFTDAVTYLSYTVADLSTIISDQIKKKQYGEAKKFIRRAVNLLVASGDFESAGDYQRWMGFIKFQETDFRSAIKQYQEAIKLHAKAGALGKVADDYKDMANVSEKMGDLAKQFDYLAQAVLNYGKSGNAEAQQGVLERVKGVRDHFIAEFKKIIDRTRGDRVPLRELVNKTKLKKSLVVEVLVDMISEGVIPGEVDEEKGEYIRARLSTAEQEDAIARMKEEIKRKALAASVGAEKSLSDLTVKIGEVETELAKWERTFEQMNLPIHRYLEYQELLDQKNFLEQQVRVLESNVAFVAEDGSPATCVVCLKPMKAPQAASFCGQGHPVHAKCLSLWVTRQTKCPVCETEYLPSSLASVPVGPGVTVQSVLSLEETIRVLKEQVENLRTENERLRGALLAVEGMTAEQGDAFQKLVEERKEKAALLARVAERDQKIKDLEALLVQLRSA
ncbi:MAG: hypothetical protein Kow0069_22790 [Promethearchaeota archaeon]